MEPRIDAVVVADRLAREFREAAESARWGGQPTLAESLDRKADVMGLTAEARREAAGRQ